MRAFLRVSAQTLRLPRLRLPQKARFGPGPAFGLLVFLALGGCDGATSSTSVGKAGGKAVGIADGDGAVELPLVHVEKIVPRLVQQKIETTSYLEAEHAVVVFARVTGRVTTVEVDEGALVTKGQVLARLDDREEQATLQQIAVQIAQKKLAHELAKNEKEASDHRQVEANILYEQAAKDLARLEALDPELVSPKELEDASFAEKRAAAAKRVAAFATRKAELEVLSAEQAIKELEAKEAQEEVQLAEHQILAPIRGVVSRREVKGGEAITTSTELFEVVDTANLVAYLDRPQDELALVEKAKTVVFTTKAYPGRSFQANVEMISPVVDRGTGSFKIRVRVKSSDTAVLRPGLYIKAEILTEESREAIMIPKTAVLAEGNDSIVFYIRDPQGGRGEALWLLLETGIEDETFIECRNRGAKGLRAGDFVIVRGQQDLKDREQVEIRKD